MNRCIACGVTDETYRGMWHGAHADLYCWKCGVVEHRCPCWDSDREAKNAPKAVAATPDLFSALGIEVAS